MWDYVRSHGPVRTHILQRALNLRGNIDSLLATMESHGFLLAEDHGVLSIFNRIFKKEVDDKS